MEELKRKLMEKGMDYFSYLEKSLPGLYQEYLNYWMSINIIALIVSLIGIVIGTILIKKGLKNPKEYGEYPPKSMLQFIFGGFSLCIGIIFTICTIAEIIIITVSPRIFVINNLFKN